MDGWTRRGQSTHGMFFYKQFPGESRPRSTVIPNKADDLPSGTLAAILGVKQTRLGRAGLQQIVEKHRQS